MTTNRISILGVGDVGPIHEPLEKYSELVRDTLAKGDIRIAQCERVYSTRGSLQVHSGVTDRPLLPSMTSVYSDCGFDVVSVAGNHAMDWGSEALLDTIDNLNARGIKVVGGGRNLAEARKPAIIERNGIKVAVLAYCSVLREGYAAGPKTPGVAPLRARVFFESDDYQPGVPPKVLTIPYQEDMDAMISDIHAAKKNADLVVLSFHWGVHFVPRLIADYQPVLAKAAFGAGADVIFGHHAHVPKAIGMHDGKACFYSLGNFIMTSHFKSRLAAKHPGKTMAEALSEFSRRYGVAVGADDPLPWGTDSARSLIAKAVATAKGVEAVSFIPVLIDSQMRPEVLRNNDPRFTDAMKFMDWVSEGFDHKFKIQNDEVSVT